MCRDDGTRRQRVVSCSVSHVFTVGAWRSKGSASPSGSTPASRPGAGLSHSAHRGAPERRDRRRLVEDRQLPGGANQVRREPGGGRRAHGDQRRHCAAFVAIDVEAIRRRRAVPRQPGRCHASGSSHRPTSKTSSRCHRNDASASRDLHRDGLLRPAHLWRHDRSVCLIGVTCHAFHGRRDRDRGGGTP